jgi:hypothetical protein
MELMLIKVIPGYKKIQIKSPRVRYPPQELLSPPLFKGARY